MFERIDKKLRILFSYLYRIIISIYLLFILYCEEGWDGVPWLSFVVIIPVYFVLFSAFRTKVLVSNEVRQVHIWERIKAWIRLILDYTVIVYFLDGYDISEFQNYFLVTLPIVNSINHSISNNRNWIVYIVCLLAILYLDNWNFVESRLAPVSILYIVIQFFKYRFRISLYKDKLFLIIDDLYGVNATQKEMTKVLFDLSTQINKSLKGIRYGDLSIDNISCYRIKGRNLILISSGKVIEKYEFENSGELIKRLNRLHRATNINMKFNGRSEPYNVVFQAKGNHFTYTYVITFTQPVNLINSTFALRLVVEPSFKHLSRILEVKWLINSERSKLYKEVRKKYEYVIKSMEVLHFVKGALSPFSILNDAIALYQDDDDIARRERTLKKIFTLREKSTMNIQTITKRAQMIYDKSGNPFVSNDLKEYSFVELFSWVRRNWEESTDSKEIWIERETEEDILNIKVSFDEELLLAVLTEIFENIQKYSGDFKKLMFRINTKNIEIELVNDCPNISNKQADDIRKQAKKHNAETRPSINQRDSKRFGLYIIKDYLLQMNMKSMVKLDLDNNYSHSIIISRNESSSI